MTTPTESIVFAAVIAIIKEELGWTDAELAEMRELLGESKIPFEIVFFQVRARCRLRINSHRLSSTNRGNRQA